MRGADRVSVAPLTEDLVARVFIDRVITGQVDFALGDEVVEDPARQTMRQSPAGPAPLGEDIVIAGGVARSQGTEGAQEVTDRAMADREDGSQGQQDDAEESRTREGTRQGVEQRVSGPGQGLLDVPEFAAGSAGLACLTLTAFAVEASSASRLATVASIM